MNRIRTSLAAPLFFWASLLAAGALACGLDESGLLGDAQAGTDATVEASAFDAAADALGGDAAAAGDAADGGGGGDAAADAPAAPDADAGSLCACSPGETCCIYVSNGSIAQIVCAAVCAGPDGGQNLSALACTGGDCADAGVCCIWRDANSVNHSACKSSCTGNDVQMCDVGAADSGCPASAPCSTNNITDWDLTPPLATCGGQSVP